MQPKIYFGKQTFFLHTNGEITEKPRGKGGDLGQYFSFQELADAKNSDDEITGRIRESFSKLSQDRRNWAEEIGRNAINNFSIKAVHVCFFLEALAKVNSDKPQYKAQNEQFFMEKVKGVFLSTGEGGIYAQMSNIKEPFFNNLFPKISERIYQNCATLISNEMARLGFGGFAGNMVLAKAERIAIPVFDETTIVRLATEIGVRAERAVTAASEITTRIRSEARSRLTLLPGSISKENEAAIAEITTMPEKVKGNMGIVFSISLNDPDTVFLLYEKVLAEVYPNYLSYPYLAVQSQNRLYLPQRDLPAKEGTINELLYDGGMQGLFVSTMGSVMDRRVSNKSREALWEEAGHRALEIVFNNTALPYFSGNRKQMAELYSGLADDIITSPGLYGSVSGYGQRLGINDPSKSSGLLKNMGQGNIDQAYVRVCEEIAREAIMKVIIVAANEDTPAAGGFSPRTSHYLYDTILKTIKDKFPDAAVSYQEKSSGGRDYSPDFTPGEGRM